mgnify:CR=1 FL=1
MKLWSTEYWLLIFGIVGVLLVLELVGLPIIHILEVSGV